MEIEVKAAITFIETTKRYAPVAVYLHKLGQRRSIEVLGLLQETHAKLLIGQFEGVILSGPVLLRDHLELVGIEYSYEKSRNLFKFIKRLLNALQKKGFKI